MNLGSRQTQPDLTRLEFLRYDPLEILHRKAIFFNDRRDRIAAKVQPVLVEKVQECPFDGLLCWLEEALAY